jgi:hypothetical protein
MSATQGLLKLDYEAIRRLRAEKGLDQYEPFWQAYLSATSSLAEDDSRMHERTFANHFKYVEKRPDRASSRYVEQIAQVLGVSTEDIVLRAASPSGQAPDESAAIRPARLHILRPVDVASSNDIIFAFFGELYRRCREKVSIDTHIAIPGCRSDYDGDASQRARHLGYAQWVIGRQRADPQSIIVAVGTTAMQALRDSFGEDFGTTPILFLGCTLPKEHRFVMSESSRNEKRQVAGVAFNTELGAIFSFLHERLLAGLNLGLGFFLRKGLTMDEMIASEFGELESLLRGRQLHVLRKRTLPRIRDFRRDFVYYGWHTGEELFLDLDPGSREVLEERMIVSPTRRFVQYGQTAVGYQGDDLDIGIAGAELLIEHLKGSESSKSLGEIDVVLPRFRCWVHGGKLNEWEAKFDFRLPKEIEDDPNTLKY